MQGKALRQATMLTAVTPDALISDDDWAVDENEEVRDLVRGGSVKENAMKFLMRLVRHRPWRAGRRRRKGRPRISILPARNWPACIRPD